MHKLLIAIALFPFVTFIVIAVFIQVCKSKMNLMDAETMHKLTEADKKKSNQ